MRVSPLKKLLLAIAGAMALVLTAVGSPAMADPAELTGSLTIKAGSGDIVFDIPGTETTPCEEKAGYDLDIEATGGPVWGDITVDLTGVAIFQKPGSSEWDQLVFEDLFQNLQWHDDGTVSGSLGMTISVINMPGADEDPEDCTKTDVKCVLAVAVEVSGTHDDFSDGADPGDVADFILDSDPNGVPVTLISGDGCGAYASIIDSEVNGDLHLDVL